jgi:[protein-PII] uridylyltransferase
VWNQWKATLLWELYAKARLRLTGGAPVPVEADARARSREGLALRAGAEFPMSTVERHLALMPDRYVRTVTAGRLRRHLRLAGELAERRLAAEWRATEHHTELTVCAADHPGLLASIAGTLTAAGVDILTVEAYTREDGIAIDTFLLSSLRGEQAVRPDRWGRIDASLVAAVEGRVDVGGAVEKRRLQARPRTGGRAPAEPWVRVDAEASEASTVVEVRADDEPGLVYRIAHTLTGLGLNIVFAKIATEKSQAFDVFYVSEAEGDKLRPERAAEVERALGGALRPGKI